MSPGHQRSGREESGPPARSRKGPGAPRLRVAPAPTVRGVQAGGRGSVEPSRPRRGRASGERPTVHWEAPLVLDAARRTPSPAAAQSFPRCAARGGGRPALLRVALKRRGPAGGPSTAAAPRPVPSGRGVPDPQTWVGPGLGGRRTRLFGPDRRPRARARPPPPRPPTLSPARVEFVLGVVLLVAVCPLLQAH